mmetsp:Transcript_31659/g.97738  ORF Transcript_31659/g.97738 Transcript_31659/m.97738 type:complete len:362 (+) Transcript_31659:452-1537(+)
MTRGTPPLDLVQHLARRRAGLEVFVAVRRLVEREGRVDGDLELARLEPAHDLVRAGEELLAVPRVVQELRAAHERRLGDVPQRRVRGHGARRVAERHEDAALRERAQRHVERRLADAVDDGLAADAVGDLHDLGEAVDGLVILIGGPRRLVVEDELVDARGLAHGGFAFGACADDFVASDLGHLRGPLARTAADAVDEHPVAGLDELRVRVGREVVRRHALDDTRHRDVHGHVAGHREALGRRHRGVLGVRPEDRVRDLVADGDVRDALAHGHDLAAALLAADERQVARVEPRPVVRVDEVDARERVLDEDLALRRARRREVGLDDERLGGAGLADDGRSHCGRDSESTARRQRATKSTKS